MFAGKHPRSAGHDVADVDGVRNHARVHRIGCVYGRVESESSRVELEVDAGFYSYPVSVHIRSCVTRYMEQVVDFFL